MFDLIVAAWCLISHWLPMEGNVQEPDQRVFPRRRRGHTTTVVIGGERFSLVATERGDGSLGEVRIGCGKHGSDIAGLMDAYATAISAGLQHGVPLADLLRPGLGLCFAPGGSTDDPEIPRVRSMVDYFSRRLAVDWLPDALARELHDGAKVAPVQVQASMAANAEAAMWSWR
jgi:hypothetical protein